MAQAMNDKAINSKAIKHQALKVALMAGTLLSPLWLSSCMTAMVSDAADKKDKEVIVHLSDTITHMGKPAQPIRGYEHALVLVGQQNGYLLTSDYAKRPQLLEDIFTKADTDYLYLDFYDAGGSYMKQQPNTSLNIDVNNECYKDNKWCATTKINFYKPLNLIKDGEVAQMESLGFRCFEPTSTQLNSGYNTVQCSREVALQIHLIEGINNTDRLSYPLKQPVKLTVTETIEHDNQGRQALKLLTPVAVGVDVITLPLQFLFFLGGMGKHGV
ncbi:hypothetical protein [Psychrobacter sp. FDAARGOS_221]|uniref:hypothetical protein n=1 Tax=Psychrobacter sp. FDAARGOS_221 TaxID=1975705 RepID=UPI000BB55442|nr:hypothetical protein [Psychrobacter sp. FDAARGOS_221]PNK60696.1 hypothetical protein A6J60_007300 [Psychrobacter sp. FDAARGOS_221]